jgi:hypothetical protein
VNPSVLFVIDTDPRSSGRAAEAVRIAAGLAVWKRIDITVYLRDAAILILGEETDELVDQDNFTRFLPVLAESGRPIYVQESARWLANLGQSALAFREISDGGFAQLAMDRSQVTRF